LNAIKKGFVELLQPNPLDHQSLLYAGIFACELTDLLIAKTEPPDTIKCKPGCPHCCHMTIPHITVPEGMYIYQWCRENGVKPKEFVKGECPFLSSKGVCAVHPARPVRCRGWNSRDVDWCKNPPDVFNIRDCTVFYPQFQVGRKVHKLLVEALEAVGYTDTLTTIDDAFCGNMGMNARILIEGLNMVMAEAHD